MKSWDWIALGVGLVLAALVLGLPAHASGLDATLGVGIGKNVLGHEPFERFGTVGLRYGSAQWKVQGNGGYWLALADGERSSYFGSLQGGLEIASQGGGYAQLLFGPALISAPDSKLAGSFQFHLSGGVGLKNSSGYGLSFLWTHFSNAGIEQPNLGRDLLTVQVLIPLYKAEGAQ